MAIVFHSEKYKNIKVDSHIIIGITGEDYQSFLKGLTGKNTYYIGNNIIDSNKKVSSVIGTISSEKEFDDYLKDLSLDKSFLNKNINSLSHSEQKILKYLQVLTKEASIIIIDEPFMDLDFDAKKRVIALFKKLVKIKTIIIGSSDTNVIYTQCKKVLLLNKKKYLYDDVKVLANKSILRQYHISMPDILAFIRLANDKGKKLPYSKDIRDLIKDVYRNVSK